MDNKHLKRFLFEKSYKLFLFYLITSVMIIAVYNESSFGSLLGRAASFALLAMIIFMLNIEIIFYYRRPEKREMDIRKTRARVFWAGFWITFLLFVSYYLMIKLLSGWGLNYRLPESLDGKGAKVVLILFLVSFIQYTFIFLIQHLILTMHEQKEIETEMLKLKNSNAETINQLLQQQIKPHFLFNALTTLKSLIKKHPDTAETYLVQLSEFLRASFASTGSKSGLAAVANELEVCQNYMEMQQVRFGQALQYSVEESMQCTPPEEQIPAFSLQPLLENAIKHNIVTNEQPLFIRIARNGDRIIVSNNLQSKKYIADSTGKGLTNLRERYRIISGDEVIVHKDDNQFSVSIKILSA